MTAEFVSRPGCALEVCPDCNMRAPERAGACVLCALLGIRPKRRASPEAEPVPARRNRRNRKEGRP